VALAARTHCTEGTAAMLTDRPPRDQVLLAAFLANDGHGTSAAVHDVCAAFLIVASYRVPRPEVRVLAARPLRLDSQRFGWRNPPHTRSFCQRTAVLYHHAQGTPAKR
jgi:hypothetical protein